MLLGVCHWLWMWGFCHNRLCIAASHFKWIYERESKISLTVLLKDGGMAKNGLARSILCRNLDYNSC
jgi:hypothetical protein